MHAESLKHCPPVRGKMHTLYSNRFLAMDIFFFLASFLPAVLRERLAAKYESNCTKLLFGDQQTRESFELLYFDSGTSALRAAFMLIGLRAGEKVFLNPNTCVAVGESIVWSGGEPTFVATNEDGLTDFSGFGEVCPASDRSVVVLTNSYGFFEDIQMARASVSSNESVIINDLSQVNILSKEFHSAVRQSDIVILSFGPEKYVAGLGGGALLVKKECVARFAKRWEEIKPKEIFSSRTQFYRVINRLRYLLTFMTIDTFAYEYLLKLKCVHPLSHSKDVSGVQVGLPKRITRIHFADIVGLAYRLRFFARRQLQENTKYAQLHAAIAQKSLIAGLNVYNPPMLILRCPAGKRFKIASHLSQKRFQTTWNYIPLFMYPPFKHCAHGRESDLWECFLQVPYRFLNNAQLQTLGDTITYVLADN